MSGIPLSLNGISRRREALYAFLLLVALTLLTRAWLFGDPFIDLDEPFYQLVGMRLAHGHLPFVDIWDRKPFGLFAIYALASLIFPDPVTGHQLMAAASTLATGWVIYSIARRFTGFGPAVAGAAAYLAWLPIYNGAGGQPQVFYNLLMALAARTIARLVGSGEPRALALRGGAAMLLVGLAIQVKYTAMFEGIFFGLSLLWLGWRAGQTPARLACEAVLWIGAAWTPTFAIWGVYAALGHGATFAQANFLSVFGDSLPLLPALGRLLGLSIGLTPLAACLWIAWKHWRPVEGPAGSEARWLFAWSGAAYLGLLVYGVWFDDYFLPMVLPLSVATALGFDAAVRRRTLIAVVLGLGIAGGLGREVAEYWKYGSAAQVDRIAAMVRANVGKRCLYVNENLVNLYVQVPTCLPTRYVFPEHLMLNRYVHALGIDQARERRRMLASRPGVIVIRERPDEDTNQLARRELLDTLKADYRQVGKGPVGDGKIFEVWALQTGKLGSWPVRPSVAKHSNALQHPLRVGSAHREGTPEILRGAQQRRQLPRTAQD